MAKNNIDIDIFMALKMSEKSGVPVLFLGNPGIGKSTAVAMFCQVRDYELIILRGNSTSPEEILGYDVASESIVKDGYSKKLFPSWFHAIKNHEKNGKKTLLFLDELTTASEPVQAALLEIIFSKRICEDVFLPEDTFIVAAGNYASNLSSGFNVLPPVLNRFAIFNLTPTVDDLDVFLNKYEGSISGSRKDVMGQLHKDMVKLDAQEKTGITVEQFNKIGEYIERSIKDTTRFLITSGDRPIDLTVANLSELYTNESKDGNPAVYGFVTFRTLNYLRDITIAYYLCFGKSGIHSANYRLAVDGLVGIGLSWDSASKKSGEPKITRVGKEYADAIKSVVNEIEKMNNSKLPEYEKFLFDALDGVKSMDIPIMQALINKILEMQRDPDLKMEDIERPIDSAIIKTICNAAQATGAELSKVKVKSSDKMLDIISKENVIGFVTTWNTMTEIMNLVGEIVTNEKMNYKDAERQVYKSTVDFLRSTGFKLRSMKKLLATEDAGAAALVPDIKSIDTK